ncbi:MAG: hypothetical protein AAF734_00520 [Bacteroidota bacterium]
MGLAERRRIAEIKGENATYQSEFNDVTGMDIPIEIDASTFPENKVVLDGYKSYKAYGVPMVINIFKDVCKDNLGKEAVKEKIKSVRVVNTSKNGEDSGEMEVVLNDGELLIKYGFYQYSDKLWGETELKEKIEEML